MSAEYWEERTEATDAMLDKLYDTVAKAQWRLTSIEEEAEDAIAYYSKVVRKLKLKDNPIYNSKISSARARKNHWRLVAEAARSIYTGRDA